MNKSGDWGPPAVSGKRRKRQGAQEGSPNTPAGSACPRSPARCQLEAGEMDSAPYVVARRQGVHMKGSKLQYGMVVGAEGGGRD